MDLMLSLTLTGMGLAGILWQSIHIRRVIYDS